MLADTNALSELARPEPDERVARWARVVPLPLSISAITLEEIRYGLAFRPNAAIEAWFERFLAAGCVVLPFTAAIARVPGTSVPAFDSRVDSAPRPTCSSRAPPRLISSPTRPATCVTSKAAASPSSTRSRVERGDRLKGYLASGLGSLAQ